MSVTSDRILVFSVLAGPIAWAVQLTVQYTIAAHLCGYGNGVLHVVTAAAVAVAITGLALSYRADRHLEEEGDAMVRRAHALARAGMLSSGFFIVVILAQGLPALLIGACR